LQVKHYYYCLHHIYIVHYTVVLAIVFAIGVLILKRRHSTGSTENVRYVKLNEPASQHPVMTTKSTNSLSYKKLKEDPEDDDNLAVGNNDDDDQIKNSD